MQLSRDAGHGRFRRMTTRIAWLLIGLAAMPPLGATQVLRMDLPELSRRADRIFRGEVVDIRVGSVEAGGAMLPTVTYRLRVTDPLKGSFPRARKGRRVVELTMLGTLKPEAIGDGRVRPVSALPQMPTLQRGEQYLLLTTRPSGIGLSAPVGLAQGAFHIEQMNGEEFAIDGLGQRFSYEELRSRIRGSLEAS